MISSRICLRPVPRTISAFGLVLCGISFTSLDQLHQHIVGETPLVHGHSHLGEHDHHGLRTRLAVHGSKDLCSTVEPSQRLRPSSERGGPPRETCDRQQSQEPLDPDPGHQRDLPASGFSTIGFSSIAPLAIGLEVPPRVATREAPERRDDRPNDRAHLDVTRPRAPPESFVLST
jgi:hypothetical protein